MAKRKAISSSLRWSVFARDGFTCRYCGARAGQENVELHADHVVSVADGGDNSYDNLLTACNRCNGGKGAKSLGTVPASEGSTERLINTAGLLNKQTKAIRAVIRAEKRLRQAAINVKCEAYGVSECGFSKNEVSRIVSLIRKHGSAFVLDCFSIAAQNGVNECDAIRYVYGIIKRKIADVKSLSEKSHDDIFSFVKSRDADSQFTNETEATVFEFSLLLVSMIRDSFANGDEQLAVKLFENFTTTICENDSINGYQAGWAAGENHLRSEITEKSEPVNA